VESINFMMMVVLNSSYFTCASTEDENMEFMVFVVSRKLSYALLVYG